MLAEIAAIAAALLASVAGYLLVLVAWRFASPALVEAGSPSALRGLMFRRLAERMARHMPAGYGAWALTALSRAGHPRELAPPDLWALHFVGLAAGATCGILLVSLGVSAGFAAAPALAGAVLPAMWLKERIKERQLAITRSLPYALDLLTLSVEAGLDFAAGLAKVVEKGRAGPLRDELALVLRELRMGKTREEALRALMERVDLASLSSFVRALIQADRMGVRLGGVLRVQAAQLRQERSQRAEKLAGEAPVKMLFPLLAFIFPTVFLVLFGPIVFSMLLGSGGSR